MRKFRYNEDYDNPSGGGMRMLDQSYYEKADEIIEHYGKKPSSLIPIMQDIQGAYRYLPGTAHLCGWKNWGNGSKSLQCCDLLREFFL